MFGVPTIEFLGHQIDSTGIRPLPDRLTVIADSPFPQSVKSLRRFLGMANYYRRFVPDCSDILEPLTSLLKCNPKTFSPTQEAETAFQAIKCALAKSTSLSHIRPDLPLILKTDASQSAVGAVLQQIQNGEPQPLSFFSRKLQSAQTRYSTLDRELLAIYLAVKHFRHLLEGRQFTIWTDHKPLTFAFKSPADRYSPRELRQLDFVSQFTTDVRYIDGARNVVADALSRLDLNAVQSPSFDLEAIANAQSSDDEFHNLPADTSLRFELVPLLHSTAKITCDLSTGKPRPWVPLSFRRCVFDHFHSISHPSIRSTTKLITDRFVWPSMRKNIREWVTHCLSCQRSKVHRHTITFPGSFAQPDARFQHVHLDIVGPLPPSKGFTHILTCVDRYSRWPQATPITDTSAETVARSFMESWIAHFGLPVHITTDRGAQFTSTLFRELNRTLGTIHFRTTAYHPASNGMVERFHRQLKAAITATHSAAQWSESLPLVLLGIRNTVKEDMGCTAAEMVYGTTLRLPGEMVVDSRISGQLSTSSYVARLRAFMNALRPPIPRSANIRQQVHPSLNSCPYVFVRVDAVKKPLQPPYDGPYRVIERHTKYYVIDKHGSHDSVNIDRLKPAFVDGSPSISVVPQLPELPASVPDSELPAAALSTPPTQPMCDTDQAAIVPSCLPARSMIQTRSGRCVSKSSKLRDFVM